MTLTLVALAVFAIGGLTGATGVGGLLLPPLLMYSLIPDFSEAVAVSLIAYVFMGAGGASVFALRGKIPWKITGALVAGAVPGAVCGVAIHDVFSSAVLEWVLALLLCCFGVQAVSGRKRNALAERSGSGSVALMCVGFAVGIVSALTGVGGPVLMIPILLLMRFPVHMAIASSVACSLPQSSAGALGYLVGGGVPIALACLLGVVSLVGAVGGVLVGQRLPQETLARIVGVVLILVGAALMMRKALG